MRRESKEEVHGLCTKTTAATHHVLVLVYGEFVLVQV